MNVRLVIATATVVTIAASRSWAGLPCQEITTQSLSLPGLRVTQATLLSGQAPYPDHCLVQAKLNERTGIDGKSYAISFEMRLPVVGSWNGRFLQQANGGSDGTVFPAVGGHVDGIDSAIGRVTGLERGFAVLSTDGGHDGADPANAPLGLAQGVAFGVDPQARIDYGYGANQWLAPIAKYIIVRFYGSLPSRSYMMGCSNGGRQGMVAASRFPWAYDGILAGAPGFNLPKAAVQHAWDIQSWLLASPNIAQAFSMGDMSLVSAKILEACDGLDGVVDGMVNDIAACQSAFHLSDLQCQGDQQPGCLNANQVAALARSFGGPKDSSGRQLYSDWPFDPGLAGFNWRMWKLESPIPPWGNLPIIAVMGSGALSYVFGTPPVMTPGTPEALLGFLAGFDFDRDAPKIFATDATYTVSAMQFMTPLDVANPKMHAFEALGGKMLIYHGQSDPVFSYNDTSRWYSTLAANHAGQASNFVRFFSVPGMNHCEGGPATDQFDALTALVNWVEQGTAPDQLLAHVSASNPELPPTWSAGRTRPLCPYPKIARYSGSGDSEAAASFFCQ